MTRPGAGGGAISFELKNDLAEIGTLAETLEGFCAGQGIDADVTSLVNLALEEVVTNIIAYGYTDHGDRRIWIDLAMDGGDLTARVQDEAPAFDPLQKDGADPEASLDERRVGGLGIQLVRTFMDEVRYAREGDRNVLFLRKSTR
jgi:anti-sigma regulatory factor (Ser/Thr protein kinase)